MPNPIPDDVLREMSDYIDTAPNGKFFDQRWPDPYAIARELLEAREAIKLLLSFVPPWAKEAPPDLCATMYGTGSQGGDLDVVEKVSRARALLPKPPGGDDA